MAYLAGLVAIIFLIVLAISVLWRRRLPFRFAIAAALLLGAGSTAYNVSELFSLLPSKQPRMLALLNCMVVALVAVTLLHLWRGSAGSVGLSSPSRRRLFFAAGGATLGSLIFATAAKAIGPRKPSLPHPMIRVRSPIRTASAFVNGVNIAYRDLGVGPAMLLIHGFPETGAAFDGVLDSLAKRYRLIVPDLRGFGRSDRPSSGYEKANIALDLKQLLDHLGITATHVVGHDIGSTVAFAFAAQFPTQTSSLTMSEAILEGLGNSELIRRFAWLLPPAKHFGIFEQPDAAEARFEGRERELIMWFMNSKSYALKFDDAAVEEYVRSFKRDRGMWAAFKHYETLWTQDAEFFRSVDMSASTMTPVLVLSGESGDGDLLAGQVRSKGMRNVRAEVVPAAGHWIFKEAPDHVAKLLVEFAK